MENSPRGWRERRTEEEGRPGAKRQESTRAVLSSDPKDLVSGTLFPRRHPPPLSLSLSLSCCVLASKQDLIPKDARLLPDQIGFIDP